MIRRLFQPGRAAILGDPFIRRLRSSVLGEGMLQDGNIVQLDYAIERLPGEGAVLEIGLYGGQSTVLINYLMQKHRRQNIHVGCDPWLYEGYKDGYGEIEPGIDGRADISRDAFMAYVKEAFVQAVNLFCGRHLPFAFVSSSSRFFDAWHDREKMPDIFGREKQLGGPLALVYVDGDHTYDAVEQDYRRSMESLVPGGFILFDDSASGSRFGSAELMHEVKQDSRLRLISRQPNHLFQRKGG